MRDEELAGLVRRIHQELAELERVLDRIQGGWELFRRSNNNIMLLERETTWLSANQNAPHKTA